jgi:DNA end-binding protein Ku
MRASWKGQLRLQLVSCPVKLYPATSRAGKVGFHNLNPGTGHRINLRPHDPDSGEEVAKDDIVKGYEVEKGHFVVLEEAEIEAVRIPSTKTIELERFVDADEVDPVYINAPYFVAPDGPVAEETYRVIRDAMAKRRKVGLGRVVLARRERVVAVEAYGNGIRMMTLHSRDEVRSDKEFFADIEEGELDDEMVDLAAHIIAKKTGKFDPASFEDKYQAGLVELVQAKLRGETPELPKKRPPAKVIDLREALKKSIAAEKGEPPRAPQRRRRKS